MKRLTSENDVKNMNMLELSHNCIYAKDGLYRYRDYDTDVNLIDFIVGISKKLGGRIVTADNGRIEDIAEEIWDNLQYGYDNIDGVIALLYTRLVALGDLRGRLNEYENIGLTPEQLKEIDTMYLEQAKELMEYKRLEQRLNGVTLEQLANAYIKCVEKEDGHPYTRGRILTNEDADKWDAYLKAEEQGLLVQLPCKVGDTVYCIAECKNIPAKLDGTLYGDNGGMGTATGYYCPYEDCCPFDGEDCEQYAGKRAVFEDEVEQIVIDGFGIHIAAETTTIFSLVGEYVFLTREAAEAKLKEMEEN